MADPVGVTVSPDGSTLYVANHLAKPGSTNGSISVVDLATATVTKTIPVTGTIPRRVGPQVLALRPDDAQLIVITGNTGTVSPIDLTTGGATSVPASGARAVGYLENGAALVARGGAATEVDVLDAAKATTSHTYPLGGPPTALAVLPGEARSPYPKPPAALALTPDGASEVLADSGGTLTVLGAGATTVTGLGQLTAVAVSPDQAPVAASRRCPAPPGHRPPSMPAPPPRAAVRPRATPGPSATGRPRPPRARPCRTSTPATGSTGSS